ncbi:MAG TPA: PCP reductase family protein [Thermoanaerobaculia bacterium]|nr:PCP reductase family protein [Thermoanaerobaculia bacterium]
MKFLCIACDEPMKLEESTPPADGAGFTATFRCPACGQGVAMLTNPWETEVVGSLGVKLANGRESRCPMGSMIAGSRPAVAADEGVAWTAGALARLERIPEMVRPMAREGIERYAKNAGRGVVDEALLEEARAVFAS